MNDSKILDRAEGALFGSALGDAIGIYTEFMTDWQALEAYGSSSPNFTLIPPETKLHNDTHRSWTDDTDHTILMMLSYLRLRELSPKDFAIRLHSWCSQGLRVLDRLPMGLGSTVVFSPSYTNDPAGTALSHWTRTAGRSLPTRRSAWAPSLTPTRAAPSSVAIVSALVRALCLGQIADPAQVRELIERAWDYVQRTQPPEHAALLDRAEFEAHAYAESLEALVLCDRAMGYVYKCLGAALWCLRRVLTRQDTFRSAMTALVMFGGDADTNGAVAGALMGALCGCEYLPKEWRDGMRHAEWYRAKVRALCCVAGLRDGVYDSESDADTELDGGKGFITEEEMKKREMGIMERMLLSEKERREKAEAKVKAQTKSSSWKSWLSGS
ncbi:ADP-ribosylation/Crystallin J1 [Mycena olivaceomarginata]|nr:ADP-ribosylation/Crystallin J1 [Mycena olivaceomarginata]